MSNNYRYIKFLLGFFIIYLVGLIVFIRSNFIINIQPNFIIFFFNMVCIIIICFFYSFMIFSQFYHQIITRFLECMIFVLIISNLIFVYFYLTFDSSLVIENYIAIYKKLSSFEIEVIILGFMHEYQMNLTFTEILDIVKLHLNSDKKSLESFLFDLKEKKETEFNFYSLFSYFNNLSFLTKFSLITVSGILFFYLFSLYFTKSPVVSDININSINNVLLNDTNFTQSIVDKVVDSPEFKLNTTDLHSLSNTVDNTLGHFEQLVLSLQAKDIKRLEVFSSLPQHRYSDEFKQVATPEIILFNSTLRLTNYHHNTLMELLRFFLTPEPSSEDIQELRKHFTLLTRCKLNYFPGILNVDTGIKLRSHEVF